MSLRFDSHHGTRQATLTGWVTCEEVVQLRGRLADGEEADIIYMENVEKMPASYEIAVATLSKLPFPKKPVAFICENALAYGFARMVAAYYGINLYQIFSSGDAALRWLRMQ